MLKVDVATLKYKKKQELRAHMALVTEEPDEPRAVAEF